MSANNIVILGVNHSNTTITTRMLEAMGWNLGPVDSFAELPELRAVNERWIECGGEFELDTAEAIIASLPQPWVVKDPRFSITMGKWVDLLMRWEPLLIWLRKDCESVKASFRRRGQVAQYVESRFEKCREHFNAWVGPKVALDAESIHAAVALFDCKWDLNRTPADEELTNAY